MTSSVGLRAHDLMSCRLLVMIFLRASYYFTLVVSRAKLVSDEARVHYFTASPGASRNPAPGAPEGALHWRHIGDTRSQVLQDIPLYRDGVALVTALASASVHPSRSARLCQSAQHIRMKC